MRGRWGEVQLRRVVEIAGMVRHCDFVEQEAIGEERRLRPDMLVRLPDNRCVVVDAKAPMAAFLEAMEAENEAAMSQKLDEHAGQLRALSGCSARRPTRHTREHTGVRRPLPARRVVLQCGSGP